HPGPARRLRRRARARPRRRRRHRCRRRARRRRRGRPRRHGQRAGRRRPRHGRGRRRGRRAPPPPARPRRHRRPARPAAVPRPRPGRRGRRPAGRRGGRAGRRPRRRRPRPDHLRPPHPHPRRRRHLARRAPAPRPRRLPGARPGPRRRRHRRHRPRRPHRHRPRRVRRPGPARRGPPRGPPVTAPTSPAPGRVQLEIEGMTCAACASRIEKRLNRIEGVSATVNFATEKATVDVPPGVTTDELIAQVEAAGYRARLPRPPADAPPSAGATGEADGGAADDPVRSLRRRLVVSALLSAPVVLLAMVPALQFDAWQWLSLTLAAPVVTWGAWPFHRAAWANLRHGAATMDTLVSVGTLAAFGWSLWALFLGDAGDPTLRHGFSI